MSDATLNRREFLATGVGLAAAAVGSARAEARGANDRINLGVVGCGSRGTYLLSDAASRTIVEA